MSLKVVLKRKRTSCGTLRYTLCSLYRICFSVLKCQLGFQVPPFLIHCTYISYSNIHLVSKQTQRSTPLIHGGRYYIYTFSKISKVVEKNVCPLRSLYLHRHTAVRKFSAC